MASVIFTELEVLKARVLPADLSGQSTWDTQIESIAKGVAGAFDRHCNRTLVRGEDVEEIFEGDREHHCLARYPVESVSEVALKDDYDSSFVAQANVIDDLDLSAGILYYYTELGLRSARVRVTYTGGYFVDTSVNQDTAQPAASEALPDVIMNAFFRQVESEMRKRDVLGTRSALRDGAQPIEDSELLASVKKDLEKFVRWLA